MKIQIKQLSDDEFVAEVDDWDDVNTLAFELGGVDYKFERGKDDPQFYTQEEMEFLGNQLIASEKRVADMLAVIEMAASTVKVIVG